MGCKHCAQGKHKKCIAKNGYRFEGKSGCPGNCQHRPPFDIYTTVKPPAAVVVARKLGSYAPGAREVPATSFTIDMAHLPELVQRYTDHIDMAPTAEVCSCEWIVHPEDSEKPEGSRRVKRGSEHPMCKVHTKRGFLMGFFQVVIGGESDDKH